MGKKLFILILILISSFFLFSCERLQPVKEGTLKFIVKDKISEEPISGAQIKITQNGALKVSAFTDENGEYNFTLAEGEYNYEVTKLNYFPTNGNVKVYPNESRTVEVLLEPTENNPPTFIGYISPIDNQIVKTQKVDFEWNANDVENDTIYYNIYLKYVGNSFIKLNDVPLTDNTYTYEPPIKGQYQWKIELWDEPNIEHKIMVLEAPTFDYEPTSDSTINHKPTIVLKEPINGVTLENSEVIFTWEASDTDKDPLTFDLFLGKSHNSFTNIVSNYNKNTYSYSLESTGLYYWQVLVSDGKETTESNISSFTYNPPPNSPPVISLISPLDNATFDTNDIEFRWIATDTDNSTLNYKLLIGKTITNMSEVLSMDNMQNKEIKYSYKLSESGEFYWQVHVSDKINPPVKSEIRKFSISSQNKPPVISDFHKPDIPTVVGTTVSFEWNAYDPEGTPLNFDFYISDVKSDVENLIKNKYTKYNLKNKYLENIELDYSSTYYWRIVAKDDMYVIPGPVWSFEFVKKEEGELPDLYFNPIEIHTSINTQSSFTLKTSFTDNIYGFDIRFGYNPEFINIDTQDCVINNIFNDNNKFLPIKKIIEYPDHNEFIFTIISLNGNFELPENIITINFTPINNGETIIKFEKSTYIYGPNEPEIIFTIGGPITVTVSE
ncbi:carboxypeptidase-like regulatory domain-containing protein [Marinitoga aeolica]|uniref:Carboxypeptidase regulatory-like domain-containing protein n=1 Tax=Marinitoga aeolica TaxID=2809031 RepID=A0ABY8PPE7_9BACT|nr:carboxypeptidase-like regulatory domain-containing protein [Marinitoga aeolica]WGS64501.1 carboxypeptidase regulatory-like domain-containing protein [Marinitoga aeolica]